jgi:hypothetical protein
MKKSSAVLLTLFSGLTTASLSAQERLALGWPEQKADSTARDTIPAKNLYHTYPIHTYPYVHYGFEYYNYTYIGHNYGYGYPRNPYPTANYGPPHGSGSDGGYYGPRRSVGRERGPYTRPPVSRSNAPAPTARSARGGFGHFGGSYSSGS